MGKTSQYTAHQRVMHDEQKQSEVRARLLREVARPWGGGAVVHAKLC